MGNKIMKKKIIFLCNHFQKSDGTARALINLVNNLDLNKFDITIKSIYRCDKKMQSELNPEIKLETLTGFYFKGLSTIMRHLPVKWLYKKTINSEYDIEIAFTCDIPTIIVGHSCNNKAVHVAWMHGYELYQDEYKFCDQVICVSKYCSDKAKDTMKENINVTYKYNLADDLKIKEMSVEDINLNKKYFQYPVFISVGRHSPEKGYVRLVKIMAQLRDEGYQFHLILVGDGPEYSKVKKTINELNMNELILLTGKQDNPHKYTKRADVFICSSFSEGYSTACTEAAILGTPIITTDVPGGKEIIDECECGLLTQRDDDSLKNGIKYVLDNPDIVKTWKNVMKHTSDKFSLENRKLEMTKIFNEFYNLSEELNENNV